MKSSSSKLTMAAMLCVLAALDALNSSLSATVRPYLMGSFASSADELAWGAMGFFSAKLVMFLLSARVVAALGERGALLGGAALLVGATAGVAMTNSLGVFIVCQLLQGASGGLVVAAGQGVLLRLYPSRSSPIAQAFFAVAVLVCPVMLAPATLGSAAHIYVWSDALLVAAVAGLFACGAMYVARQCLLANSSPVTFPSVRILALVVAIGCLVHVLMEGTRHAWLESPGIVWNLIAGLTALASFAFLERRSTASVLDYGCFRLADFTFGTSVSLVAGAALLGSSTVIGMLATGALGYSAMESGLLQLAAAPFALLVLFCVALVLRAGRIPPPLLLVTGIALLGFGLWRLGFMHTAVAREHLLPPIALRGAGLGLLLLTLTMLTLRKLPSGHEIAGAGFFNFNRQLGGLIGLAWMLTLHERLMSRNHEALASTWGIDSAAFAETLARTKAVLTAQGVSSVEASSQAMALLAMQYQQQTFTVALNGCFQALAMLFVFACPWVVLTRIVTERKLQHGH